MVLHKKRARKALGQRGLFFHLLKSGVTLSRNHSNLSLSLIDRSAESVQSLLPLLPGTYFLVLACGVDLALDEKDKSATARICQSSCGRLVPVTLPRHDPTLLSRAFKA
jgi:hypothetical protein